MTLQDIFETTEESSQVIIRYLGGDAPIEIVADWDNISKYADLSIMCIIPKENKLIVEVA